MSKLVGEGIVATGTNPVTTSGTINLAVCLNEFTTTTDNDCGCYFAVVDSSGVQSKLCKSNINNSGFNNDGDIQPVGTVIECRIISRNRNIGFRKPCCG